jgi:Cu-Zn family superoxide dismutase
MRISKLTMVCVPALMIAACGGGGGEESGNAVDANTVESSNSGPIEEAPAVSLVNGEGQIIGEVRAGDSPEGAVFQIVARDLPAGVHGMHIHDVGLCEGPAFESAGPHWNPEDKEHGLQNPQGPHRGDLPNITVGEDGAFKGTVMVENSNLRGSRLYGFANQIIDDNGAALVIHAQPDDYTSQPSGSAGDRIACAVLGAASMQPVE